MNHEEARPGSNLDSNSQIWDRDDTVYTRLGMWVHDGEICMLPERAPSREALAEVLQRGRL